MPSKPRAQSLRVYDVSSKTGARRKLDVDRLVLELRPGVEVEIPLAPHPNFAGQLNVVCPPFDQMKSRYAAGEADSFAVFYGAENILHVMVERRKRSRDSMRGPKRARASARSRRA